MLIPSIRKQSLIVCALLSRVDKRVRRLCPHHSSRGLMDAMVLSGFVIPLFDGGFLFHIH